MREFSEFRASTNIIIIIIINGMRGGIHYALMFPLTPLPPFLLYIIIIHVNIIL